MSANRYWCPIAPEEENYIELGLASPIAKKYLDSDGSLSGEVLLGSKDVDFLYGLLFAGIEGADELIGAIEKYGVIKFVITHR